MKTPTIKVWPGYFGAHSRDQAEGAIPNGTRVRKLKADPGGDRTPNGTLGTVLGSIDAEQIDPALTRRYGGKYFYFVEWSNKPGVAVGVVDVKIAREQ